MKRLALLITLAFVLPVAGHAHAAPPAPSAVDVGSRAQLFIDRTLVASADGVTFGVVPARKHQGNPVIVSDQPWERYIALFGDVIYDEEERLFKMWYTAAPPPQSFRWNGEEITAHVVCYATSRDGLSWEKPPVGTLSSDRFDRHNAVAPLQSPVVFKDPGDPDPSRRYKMIGVSRLASNTKPKHPTDTFVSPDGLQWTCETRDIHRGTQDVVNGFHDRRTGTYVAVIKRWPYPRQDGLPRRVFGVITSPDFRTWSEPNWVFHADEIDHARAAAKVEEVRIHFEHPQNPPRGLRADIQGVSVYQHEGGLVTFPWVFHYFRGFEQPKELRDEGQIELQVGTLTDDYATWHRPWRDAIVPPGRFGEWDSGFLFGATKAIDVGDEVWLYYDGGNWTHGFNPRWFNEPRTVTWKGQTHTWQYRRAIGLAKWTRDRFVAASAGDTPGTLLTVPLTFTGRRLEINAAAHEGGSIRVGLCDEHGKPLDGWQAGAVTGDELRHAVRFAPGRDLAALRGKPLRLRFRLQEADLFSFAFRD